MRCDLAILADTKRRDATRSSYIDASIDSEEKHYTYIHKHDQCSIIGNIYRTGHSAIEYVLICLWRQLDFLILIAICACTERPGKAEVPFHARKPLLVTNPWLNHPAA